MNKSASVAILAIMASASALASNLYISSAYYSGYVPELSVPPGPIQHGVFGFTNTIPTGWSLAIRGEIKPAVGSAGNPVLDLFILATSTSFTVGPVENLGISLSDDAFGPTSGSFLASLTGGVTAGVATPLYYATSYWTTTPGDEHHGPTTTTTTLTSSGLLAGPDYSSSLIGTPISDSQYGLTESLGFIGRGPNQPGATYSVHAMLTLIPEPGIASLVACGVIVIFGSRSRTACSKC